MKPNDSLKSLAATLPKSKKTGKPLMFTSTNRRKSSKMLISYLGHICTGTGNCYPDPEHSVVIKAHGYDDALEKFSNTVNKDDEIHVFIYDMESRQCLSSGFFGKASHWQSVT